MASLADTDIVIQQDTTFSFPISITTDAGVIIPLAANVFVSGKIKSDFGASPTVYAVFTSGAIDTANGALGFGLTTAAATTYVALAVTSGAFSAGDDVRLAPFGVFDMQMDETTDTESITVVSIPMQQFTVAGDFARMGDAGAVVVITTSTGNDGTYVSVGSIYDSIGDTTIIAVAETIPNAVADGVLTLARNTRLVQGNASASREVNT